MQETLAQIFQTLIEHELLVILQLWTQARFAPQLKCKYTILHVARFELV